MPLQTGARCSQVTAQIIPINPTCFTGVCTCFCNNTSRSVDALLQDVSGANYAAGTAHDSADVTFNIITDAHALATDAAAAQASGNASEQATPTKGAGALAKVMAACAHPSKRRKCQIAECSSDSEVRCPHSIYQLIYYVVLVP